MMIMARFVPKDKMSKKARKELNSMRRTMWDFSPVSRAVDSRKRYNRKRIARNCDDDSPGDPPLDPYFPSGKLVKAPRSTFGNPYFSFASAMALIMKLIFRARFRIVCSPSKSFRTSSAVKPCT